MNGLFDMPEPSDGARKKWNPTPEQFAAYQAKEVEMARANLDIAKRAPYDPRDREGWARTLHSRATLLRAVLT